MPDEATLRKAAMKGFLGHSALLDPDRTVQYLQGATSPAPTEPASEFMTAEYQDQMQQKASDALNQRLIQQGYTQAQIDESNK